MSKLSERRGRKVVGGVKGDENGYRYSLFEIVLFKRIIEFFVFFFIKVYKIKSFIIYKDVLGSFRELMNILGGVSRKFGLGFIVNKG